MEIFIGIGAGLLMFILCLKSYTVGLEHGKKLGNNNIPKVELNPIKAVRQVVEEEAEHREVKKKEEEEKEYWEQIENYDPYKAIKKEI
jgi:cell shape-determining protein MreC